MYTGLYLLNVLIRRVHSEVSIAIMRQTDRQTDRDREKERKRETDRQRERQTDRQTETDRHTDRDRQAGRQAGRQEDKQTENKSTSLERLRWTSGKQTVTETFVGRRQTRCMHTVTSVLDHEPAYTPPPPPRPAPTPGGGGVGGFYHWKW